MRALAYIRVSSDEQEKKGYGLEDQRERILAFAERKGFALAEADVYEDVYSSKEANPDRTCFYELLAAIERAEGDVILTLDTSRLGRNMMEKAMLHQAVKKSPLDLMGVRAGMSFTSTPENGLYYWMKSAHDWYENAKRVDRSQSGKEKKAQHGYWPHSRDPTGYTAKGTGGKGRVLVPDEDAWIIAEIYERYVATESIPDVGDWVKKNTRMPGDAPWVWKVLQNRVYLGLVNWQEDWFPGRHEPLVSPGLFMAAQAARRRGPGRPSKKPWFDAFDAWRMREESLRENPMPF